MSKKKNRETAASKDAVKARPAAKPAASPAPAEQGPGIDIGIGATDRKAISQALAAYQADAFTLYLKTHNFHWNVTGPMFNTLHLMFEAQYTELALAVDLIAERIRALGFPAPGTYAAYISPLFVCVIGILASIVCYGAVQFKNKIGLDDALDVWPVHGVGGMMGMIWLGLFADKEWNPVSVWENGLLLGGSGKFFGVQVLSIAISSIWSFSATIAIFWIVDRITKVRVPASMEADGLDWGLHEEVAEAVDH